MRSMNSRDKNTFFRVNRGHLIDEQLEGNQLIFDIESTRQKFSNIPRPAGRDKNTFFRVRKTLQPTLRTRIIKDVDPLSRVVGSLPTTKKERQADAVVASIEGILNTITGFMSAPVLDNAGNPVIDPITNQPVMKLRSISNILDVVHAGLNQAFVQNNIVLSPAFIAIANSLTVESTIQVMENIKDITKLRPNLTTQEKTTVWKNEIIAERIDKDEEIKANTEVARAIPEAIIEQKTNNGEWRGLYPDNLLRPQQWNAMNSRQRTALIDFISTRESRTGSELTSVMGNRLSYNTIGPIKAQMTRDFNRNAILNLDTLQFVRRSDIFGPLRDAPQVGVV